MTTNDYVLTTDEGAPFFWLADTAWNLWCRGTPDEWDHYLSVRKRQGFNVVQFVAGWWRGSTQPSHGRPFDVANGRVVYNEDALRSLDLLFDKIQAAKMIAAPVMIWTLTDIDPGQIYSEQECIEIARAQLRRWNADNVVWLLAGDGDYTTPEAESRWKRIGRSVFADYPDAVATLHPCGVTWVGDSYADEPWYSVAAIQSGHGSQERDLRFLLDGDYASAWRRRTMPFLNLEPNYEDARSYAVREHLTAYHVRRASYWSLLVAPPAGVTYGNSSIWMWAQTAGEIAENHDETCVGRPWRSELDTSGAYSMRVLRSIFERLPWPRLRPEQNRLRSQPGDGDYRHRQSVAATPEGDCLVFYSPLGDRPDIDLSGIDPKAMLSLVNPQPGDWVRLGAVGESPAVRTPLDGTSDYLLIALARQEAQ